MREVSHEPVARQICDLLQRARFFKEMRRAGNDLQFYFTMHLPPGLLIKLDNNLIFTADN